MTERTSSTHSLQAVVAKRFKTFLAANGLRQTPERYALLKAIYDIDGLFTIEELSEQMDIRRFPVSTATIYSAMQLFVQANLVIRHPFSTTAAVYERISDDRPRCYQICSNCHHITRIKSKELAKGVTTFRPRRFTPTHRVAYIYGVCPKCEKQQAKAAV